MPTWSTNRCFHVQREWREAQSSGYTRQRNVDEYKTKNPEWGSIAHQPRLSFPLFIGAILREFTIHILYRISAENPAASLPFCFCERMCKFHIPQDFINIIIAVITEYCSNAEWDSLSWMIAQCRLNAVCNYGQDIRTMDILNEDEEMVRVKPGDGIRRAYACF
jgi:hypothetical protein